MIDVTFSKNALKDLEEIPKENMALILEKIEYLSLGKKSDIKKLKSREDYRLRVGNYRVFFTKSDNKITILGISHRQGAYKR